MLDQNTDRMWYVIGAVLIGAAIIFAANALFDGVIMNQIDSFMDGLLNGAESNIKNIELIEDGGNVTIPGGLINLFKLPLF